jgi:hypothetical protein
MTDRICKADDCDRDATGKRGGGRGWCATHYMRWRRHGDHSRGGPVLRQHSTGEPCQIDSCTRLTIGRSLCENHYRRWKRCGDPLAGRVSPGKLTPAERFWTKITVDACCWMWTDAPNGAGYGTFNAGGGVHVMAHRYSFLLAGNLLTPGLTLDHLCRVPLCVRPDHLEEVTYAENLRRAREAADDRAVCLGVCG